MKKKLSQKLSLNKETIAHLSKKDSGLVLGGAASAAVKCTDLTYSMPIIMTCVGEVCHPTGSPCPIPKI